MMNSSGLEPRGRAVLVRPYDPTMQKSELGRKLIIPKEAMQQGLALEMMATVVAVGNHCWPEEPEPRANPGDLVIIAKMSGALVQGPKDGQWYRAINDRDLFMRVEEGAHNG